MPIIGMVGRRSWSVRGLIALIFVVLTAGALTMVYPFLLMISGSFKSHVDFHTLDPLPAFWFDDTILFRKHIEAKYNEDQDATKFYLEVDFTSYETLDLPRPVSAARLRDWLEWEQAEASRLPPWFRHLGAIRANGNKIVPQNLHLFRRRLQERFASDLTAVNQTLDTYFLSWPTVLLPRINWPERRRMPQWSRYFEEYLAFEQTRPLHEFYYSNLTGYFRHYYLALTYKTIQRYNQRHGTAYASFNEVPFPAVCPVPAASQPTASTASGATEAEEGPVDPAQDWERFVRGELAFHFITYREEALPEARAVFHDFLRRRYAPLNGRTPTDEEIVARYNQLHGTAYARLTEVPLPDRYPVYANPTLAQARSVVDWQDLLTQQVPAPGHTPVRPRYRYVLPIRCVAVDGPDIRFRDHLKRRYGGDLAALNRAYAFAFRSWEEIDPVLCRPYLRDRFQADLPALNRQFGTTYRRWDDIRQADSRRLLMQAYEGELSAFNAAIQTRFADWDQITPPLLAAEHHHFQAHTADIRHEFTVRNYRMVIDYVLLHGPALVNTVILVVLTILTTLTVNPLCAYALSRYNLPNTYKILLFCMATMAFPHEVTMIPSFLMLKEFGMLNTFAALVVPTMANGYYIFLLKGFFDSLPQELYESAQIDGAGEFRMFWTITLACSKPVLAVIALQSFQAAYSMFMFAFITCQDERMWTIMVWLYQLQQSAAPFVMFAALCIAAIPTLIVFVLAQGVIMRGIIVPVEK